MNFKKPILAVCLFSLFSLFPHFLFSQGAEVTGKVTSSANGNPLSGVSVTPKGTVTGTTTGDDGSFRIQMPAGVNILVFSYVGFATQEVNITGNISLNIVLVTSEQSLGEVVVIGYGTARKKDLTGSIATVSSKDFQKGNITTPEQLIAGKVAGVSIISNGGQPGQGSTIRIRGGSSLNASNDPLIVIDGVPLDNGGISGGNNPLSFINSNDIESFTVLKDASAAAIYGTRAANGVIIITTKKGKGGALKVNFTSLNSISSNTKTLDVLNGDQIREIVNSLGTAAQKAQLGTANTDWQDQIYQSAFATNNNISISGGVKGLPYRVSFGYLNQNGILKTDNLEKFSGAIVLNPVLFDNHLKIDINLKGAVQKYRFANQGAIGTSVFFDPTKPVYSDNKRYNGYWEWLDPNAGSTFGQPYNRAPRNPLAQLYDRHDNSNAQRSIGNIQIDYKFHFFPDLHANLNLGYDVSKGTGTIFVSDSSSLEYATGGENNHYKQTKQNTVLEFYLNYVKDIKSIKSRVDVVAGYSYNNYQTTNYNYASYDAHGVQFPNSDPSFPFNKPENTLISYFGRANFVYNDRYLLTATLRRDGSSRFAPKNRWGLFPSVALAWKVKDESFLKNSNVVSDLKLRIGYGITGQQDGIGNYDYLSYYALSGNGASYYFGDTYFQLFRPGGFYANRKWEETTTYNIAIDYGFLNNRVGGSIDFYLKKTADLLNSIPQPAGTNFSAYILANVGSMENKGVEFSINAQPVRNKKITWDVTFNATYNKNTITLLTVVPDDPYYIGFPSTNIAGSQGFAFLNAVGSSKNTFYLYHQIYGKDGKPIEGLFEDINRDGILNENDKYKGKRADPNMFYGFSTNITYGKWNAGFVMRASFNNYVYNNIYSNAGKLTSILNPYVLGNASVNYLETEFTGATEQQALSDYYIQNASFLKMDNLNVGYDFGRVYKNKASLRANLSIQNVFVITKYKGLDPEIGNGVDNNLYPRPRIIALGLNLDF
jgi:TonB-dependent starch-binding outer membrane protein SusC